jgi:hypothetical protein
MKDRCIACFRLREKHAYLSGFYIEKTTPESFGLRAFQGESNAAAPALVTTPFHRLAIGPRKREVGSSMGWLSPGVLR